MKRLALIGTIAMLSLMMDRAPLRAESAAAQKTVLSKVDFAQRLGESVPLDAPFFNEQGKSVKLGSYFTTGKPVILALVYYQCPMLCTETLNGLVRAIRSLSLSAGKDFDILTISFDPHETSTLAAAKKRVYTERYGRRGTEGAWSFLTGPETSIHRLTEAVGFHYTYDAELDQFAHPTGLVVLTPDGKISHYLYGVEYSARDLRLALLEASHGTIGTPVDKFLLFCYHYDPLSGKYNLRIERILQASGILTVLIIAGIILFWTRAEKSLRPSDHA